MTEYDTKTLQNLQRAAEIQAEENRNEGEEEGTSSAEIVNAGQQGAPAANPED